MPTSSLSPQTFRAPFSATPPKSISSVTSSDQTIASSGQTFPSCGPLAGPNPVPNIVGSGFAGSYAGAASSGGGAGMMPVAGRGRGGAVNIQQLSQVGIGRGSGDAGNMVILGKMSPGSK